MSYRTLLVTSRPQPLFVGQPLNKGTGLGLGWTLANNDQTNPVFVSTSPGIKSTDSDAIQVAPLGSIPVDPTLTSYIISAGPSVQCFLMPGGGTWAPSPAQVAAQINALGLMKDTTGAAINGNVTGVAKDGTLAAQTSGATIASDVANSGVPLLSKSSVIFSNLSHTITAGGVWQAFINSSFTKPTYEVFITLGSLTADATPWAEVVVSWKDSASATQVSEQRYVLGVGTTTSNQYHGIGPIHGDQCSIFINSLATTNTMTAGLVVLNNSNPALVEFWKSENLFSINGQTIPSTYLGGDLLCMQSSSITNGGNLTRQIPFYAGPQVTVRANTASNTTDLEIEVRVPSSLRAALGLPQTTPEFWDWNSDSHGLIQQVMTMPRVMMEYIAINHNAAAQTIITNISAGT